MEKRTIEDIKYLFKRCKDEKKPRPIIFLGAGFSISAGIPLASQIVETIFEKYKENPQIIKLLTEKSTDYYQVMKALSADERRELFRSYIRDEKVKVNVANIYLAQLLKEDYIDYVFTVNFDDLFLKACALFNFIPPVYDISNLPGYTTTNFQEKSITYLHGQYYGQWLLNSSEEINKVKNSINDLFNRVCHKRPWIVIGYSGQDEVFDALAKFQNFENGLYWIGYNENEPSEKIKDKLLTVSNKGAYWVSGYDADSFFLKLHAELELETPALFNKPFSFLLSMINNIKEIEGKEEKEHFELFKSTRERMEISKKWITDAIENIENKDSVEKFRQEIIDAVIKEEFNEEKEAQFLKTFGQSKFKSANIELSGYFNNWGIMINELFNSKGDEELFKKCVSKYKTATELNPKYDGAYYNWGCVIYDLAKLKKDLSLYNDSFEKFKIAIQINPKNHFAFNNWGNSLLDLAKLKQENLIYQQSIEKYKASTKINPKNDDTFNNWGIALSDLAKLNNDKGLYNESIEKYKIATQINPKNDVAFNNWGIALYDLAKLDNNKELFLESIEKYKIATQINPKHKDAFINWGIALSDLAKFNNDKKLYLECIEKYKIAIQLNPNDSDAFNNWGIALTDLAKMYNDEKLFIESIEKYKEAHKIEPEKSGYLNNLSASILHLSYFLSGSDQEKALHNALETSTLSHKLNGDAYNLACTHALLKNKTDSLIYLKESLEKKQISVKHVLEDRDWNNYKDDYDFKKIIEEFNT